MSFDSNTWYSIQNYGNDFFLNCTSVGNCVTGGDGTSDSEWFQLASLNGSSFYYIRPKAQKADSNNQAYCVNLAGGGQPEVVTCNNQSPLWGIGNWNGQNSGDGRYFFNIPQGDAQRLSLSNNQTYSFIDYNGLSENDLVLMQWGVSSRAAINDQSYSSVPPAIASGAGLVTTTSSPANSTSTTTSSGSESSSSADSTSASGSSTLSGTSPPPSTTVMVVTPTVTASRTSATSASATAFNGAEQSNMITKTALALMVILPHLLLRSF